MFFVSDVPQDRTTFGWLRQQTRLDDAARSVVSPIPSGEVIRLPLAVGLTELAEAVNDAIQEGGVYGFESSDFRENDPDYANQSLAFNPDIPTPAVRSTLGTPTLTRAEHYYADSETIRKIGMVKGSYYDTYGFRVATPLATKYLSPLLSTFKRSQIRSRISIIRGGRAAPSGFSWGWHRDESVFENLRVNIPLTACSQYGLQISKSGEFPQADGPHIVSHTAQPGEMLSWDTNLPHRAYATGVPAQDRTSIVLGFSPWFNYDEMADAWYPNEFFGKKHPLQMLIDGDIL